MRLKGLSMTARPLSIAGSLALALLLAGCSLAGIKPLPGNRTTAAAAVASFAPVTATPAGHVPKAAAVPPAPSSRLLGYAGRVIVRESGYNPAARNGPYYGLMQISHATARGMGYRGEASGLLDAETNLRYAVRYLAGAYVTAGGNDDRAVQFYARGYYYDAKRLGLLEKSGLR